MTKLSLWLLLPSLLWPMACKRSTARCSLRVAAASSLLTALDPIHKAWTSSTKCHVLLDTGSSGVLRRKIERGAPHDVFLSASRYQMARLQRRGYVLPTSLRTFVRNRLVLVHPRSAAPQLSTKNALRRWLRQPKHRVAIGDPTHVPAGRYAREALSKLGLWRPLQPRLVRTQHVRAALHTLRHKHLAAAVVFASDAHVAQHFAKVSHTFAAQDHSPILYVGAIVKRSKRHAQGQRYLAHLLSPTSQRSFQAHGFFPTRPRP